MLRDQTRTQTPQKRASNLCSFLIEVTQGTLFIVFSLNFYGSDECIKLKKNALIFGIIMLIGCFFILYILIYKLRIEQIFKGTTDICGVGCFRFLDYILFHSFSIQSKYKQVDLFDNEDCGELRTFTIVFYLSSLIIFVLVLFVVVFVVLVGNLRGQRLR